MKRNLTTFLLLTTCAFNGALAQKKPSSPLPGIQEPLPNIVLIMTDDQGYADVGKFGATDFKTPNLDRMADDGLRFTNWYVPQAVCGASRAGLLTGCYPNRIGMLGAPGPSSKYGINKNEVLLPELVKQKGYTSALFGKWHLGHHKKFLPLQHGFDEYYGLPYSNDMWPYHPGVRHLPLEQRLKKWPHLPMMEGNRIINKQVEPRDQVNLTTQYTEKAVDFINRNKANHFFLYVAHSMPHVPLFVSDKFKGKSKQGLYGDVIMEIDWSVGEILGALDKNDLATKTLVIFTSDNGPWLSYGNHAGNAGPLREGKATTWEGGQRVPFIARWIGQLAPGGVCETPAMHIDLFPTIARLINATPPKHRIDGKDIRELFAAPSSAKSPHEAYYFFWGNQLQAVRSDKWSLHLPHSYRSLKGAPGNEGLPGPYQQLKTGLELYDLSTDIGQRKDLSKEHPEVAAKLKALAEKFDASLKNHKRARGSL